MNKARPSPFEDVLTREAALRVLFPAEAEDLAPAVAEISRALSRGARSGRDEPRETLDSGRPVTAPRVRWAICAPSVRRAGSAKIASGSRRD